MVKRFWAFCAALIVAVYFCQPGISIAQEDVLIPAGPTEFHVEKLPAAAKGVADFLVKLVSEAGSDETPRSEYWLGVQVATLPDVAKKQLAVEDGLAVEEVTPDSPAAKAEIRKYDILIKAGDAPLKTTADLVKAVDASQGKEMTIIILRDGKNQTIKLTTDKRPNAELNVETIRKTLTARSPELAGEIKQLEEALEKLKSKVGNEGIGFFFAKPAIVGPHIDVKIPEWTKSLKGDLPKDLSVQISKEGDKPAKIHVKRGDKEWDVTEDKLNDLPDDIRHHIEHFSGRMIVPGLAAAASRVLRVTPEGKVEGSITIAPSPPKPPAAPKAPNALQPPTPLRVQVAPIPAKAYPTPQVRGFALRTDHADTETDSKLDAILKKLDERSGAIEKLDKRVEDLRKEIDELKGKSEAKR